LEGTYLSRCLHQGLIMRQRAREYICLSTGA
jgi:hypothetical protein